MANAQNKAGRDLATGDEQATVPARVGPEEWPAELESTSGRFRVGSRKRAVPLVRVHACMNVGGAADLSFAQSAARLICEELDLPPERVGKVLLAVQELGENLLSYAHHGTMTISSLSIPLPAIEVFAQDDGAGLPEGALASLLAATGKRLRELEIVRRISDEFDVHTGSEGTHVRFALYF